MKLYMFNIHKFVSAFPSLQIIYNKNSVLYNNQTLREGGVIIFNINKYFNYMWRARI